MKSSVLIISFVAAVTLILIYSFFKKPANSAENIDINLDKSVLLSIEYLSKNTLPSGRFVYNSNVDPEIKYSNVRYNALRHAGTLYSMYLCEKYLHNNTLQEKRYQASEYFVKRYVKEVLPNKYAVVSDMKEEKLTSPQAKLGGSGLALIGLSNLYPDGKIDLKILRGLGDFIIYMQKPDGSFYSKFLVDKVKKDEEFVSLYYPGEACLGLLYLNEVDPQKKWVKSAKKGLLYLADLRKDKGSDVPFDHWAMLATRKLFETPDNGLTVGEKMLLQKHAEQMADSMLYKQRTDLSDMYRGGFKENVRLCSIGTIMEGLVAIYYCTDDVQLKGRVLTALDLGTKFLSRYQVKEGETRGGIPTSAYWKLPNAEDKTKVIRVDNVQHVLSAWITYMQIQK